MKLEAHKRTLFSFPMRPRLPEAGKFSRRFWNFVRSQTTVFIEFTEKTDDFFFVVLFLPALGRTRSAVGLAKVRLEVYYPIS